jgi:prephenate dehydrogenase
MPELLIVGLGLIGGSVGMAAKRRGWRVRYVDDSVNVDEAVNMSAADERADEIRANDFVLLATPVDAAMAWLTEHDARLVTSVCSVMQPLREAARSSEPSRRTFIAGHPMAGDTQRGLAAARADLFEDKRWFLDAHHPEVAELVRDCGATAEVVNAAEHDRSVALTSHLPQLLSTALAAYLGDNPGAERFAGEGLKTFLRLAQSHESVWESIIHENANNIAVHADAVTRIVEEMLEGNVKAYFEKARG